jgi:CheY-like chemotaxis protein
MSKFRVLIVDDYRPAAVTTSRIFEVLGHEVHTAYNGLSALDKAQEVCPDLVMLDIGMPEMDGYEVCRRMRENPALKDAKIYAQTGWGGNDNLTRSTEAGFDGHFVKPVKIQEIEQILSSVDAKAA